MLTVQQYPITAAPVRLLSTSASARIAVLRNDGLCPVWLGTASVEAGAGRRLDPDELDTTAVTDELYAAGYGCPIGSVTVEQWTTA